MSSYHIIALVINLCNYVLLYSSSPGRTRVHRLRVLNNHVGTIALALDLARDNQLFLHLLIRDEFAVAGAVRLPYISSFLTLGMLESACLIHAGMESTFDRRVAELTAIVTLGAVRPVLARWRVRMLERA